MEGWYAFFLSRRLKTHVMDKYGLIEKIKKLEGLTNDEKSALIGLLREHRRYGLVWEDKPEAVEDELKTQLPVLKEVKERAIINDSETEHYPNHILIEGDNLHALTVLSYTHAGSIDVIYIDPPYNTGNKDFVYNDHFVDPEDIYRHSKWLSFMNRRLKIAKKLLSDNGVIFISIGDDEQANLKMLCDEVFLPNNFIEEYLWESTFRPDNSSPILRRNAEFVLCYAKNKSNIAYFKGDAPKTQGMPSLTKAKEKLKEITFPACKVKTLLPDGIYKHGIKPNGNNPSWELVKDIVVANGIIITPLVLKGHSYWATQKKIHEELNNGTEIWIKTDSFVPYYKKAKTSENRPTKILNREIVNDYLFANTELSNLFENKVFNNPKPTTLISYLVNFCDKKDITILDFFAGSGTTMDATMKLNAEDGGHRQCILVTNNENGICENVTYERNRRVIEGYTTPKGEHVDGLTHNNLRYYKTDFVPRQKAPKNMRALVSAATDMLCIKENMYHEVAQFGPWKALPDFALRHFTDDKGGEMLIIYREGVIEEVVDALVGMKFKKKLKIYVFSPDRDPYANEFEEVEDKVELCALPAAIYDAYREVMPKADDPLVPYTEHGETVSMDDDEEEGKEETR